VLKVTGYGINTLTMFGMVLAIGLLVDDAIVVVENVERIMSEEGLSPKEATRKSMGEITGALIGIALVLTAVFLPMAFFGGSTGVIYRQFSITIVSAMVLSVVVALVLTPALCATLLKPIARDQLHEQRGFFGWFNRNFARSGERYLTTLAAIIARPLPTLVGYGVALLVLTVLFVRLPTGFLPVEDQGSIFTQVQLAPGAIQRWEWVATGNQPTCRLTGYVKVIDGGDRDVEVFVLTSTNYDSLSRGGNAFAFLQTGKTSAVILDVTSSDAGRMTFVISNRFSPQAAKVVQLRKVQVVCQ